MAFLVRKPFGTFEKSGGSLVERKGDCPENEVDINLIPVPRVRERTLGTRLGRYACATSNLSLGNNATTRKNLSPVLPYAFCC